jgi:epoxyqueuosine reductase
MGNIKNQDINAQIIEQALNFGASVAGIATVEALKNSPSHFVFEKLGSFDRVRPIDPGDAVPGKIAWSNNAGSAVVVGVEHPEDKPELDWWQDGLRGGTPGNRILMDITSSLSDWFEKKTSYKIYKLPYHFEKGGIFLKDAAVMAGLGCIGKNNLFVTPDYGPRVRLRAILLDVGLPASRAVDFNPCKGCDMPCRTVCPQAAFQKKIYRHDELGLDELPARNGVYSRQLCNHQMEIDINNSEKFKVIGHNRPGKLIKYCRLCEFACPVGSV